MNWHYKKNVGFLVRDYNKVFPLPCYFHDIFYGKGEFKIADLGAGPVCTLGGKKAGNTIKIYASDINAQEYKEYTDAIGEELLIPIEYQDMENLTYPDEMFDVVHCVNALWDWTDSYYFKGEAKDDYVLRATVDSGASGYPDSRGMLCFLAAVTPPPFSAPRPGDEVINPRSRPRPPGMIDAGPRGGGVTGPTSGGTRGS